MSYLAPLRCLFVSRSSPCLYLSVTLDASLLCVSAPISLSLSLSVSFCLFVPLSPVCFLCGCVSMCLPLCLFLCLFFSPSQLGDGDNEDFESTNEERVTFTHVSSAIEGACKVYGYRVEAVYDQTYHVNPKPLRRRSRQIRTCGELRG